MELKFTLDIQKRKSAGHHQVEFKRSRTNIFQGMFKHYFYGKEYGLVNQYVYPIKRIYSVS